MKRLLFIVLSALLLFSCAPTVTTPTGPTPTAAGLFVYNSPWHQLTADDLAVKAATRALARDLSDATTKEDVQAVVDAYNSTHTDDQLHIEETEVPVEQAPDAVVKIARTDTNKVMYEGVFARAFVVDRMPAWKLSAECIADPDTGNNIACTLYVDKDPPAEVLPPPPEDPTYKYYIYLLDKNGHIVHFCDCGTDPYPDAYLVAVNNLYKLSQEQYTIDTPELAPFTILKGHLYIDPNP